MMRYILITPSHSKGWNKQMWTRIFTPYFYIHGLFAKFWCILCKMCILCTIHDKENVLAEAFRPCIKQPLSQCETHQTNGWKQQIYTSRFKRFIWSESASCIKISSWSRFCSSPFCGFVSDSGLSRITFFFCKHIPKFLVFLVSLSIGNSETWSAPGDWYGQDKQLQG